MFAKQTLIVSLSVLLILSRAEENNKETNELTDDETETEKEPEPFKAECMIYSDPHGQYLYARYKFFGWHRKVKMWNEHKYRIPKQNFTDEDPSGVWYFEPISGLNETFFIRNKKYKNEYLRGSNSFEEFFKKRNRKVFTQKKVKPSQDDNEYFMWKVSLAAKAKRPNIYHIVNVQLDLPLYTRSFYDYIENNTTRKISSDMSLLVSISMNKPHSDEYQWELLCRDGKLPKQN